jgi:uncharacterized protein (TIGR03089 family)
VDRAQSPEALFAAVRAEDSARAVVTFYDDTTGERMELSAASLGNWVAKTHFLLLDELGLGPGDRAYVDLPLHWQRLVVWLGAWSAGLEVVTNSDGAQVAFVSTERAGSAAAVDDVFALALAPWGRGFDGGALPPAGTQDFVVAVRPQPDAWGSVRPTAGPGDPAFDGLSRAELMTAARALAVRQGLDAGARVSMSDLSPGADRPEPVLAVLSVAGSLVLTRAAATPADPAATTRRAEQERVTHRL